ncbi:MAG: Cation/H+ exchanger [Benniella sp.]|nr:MAG: Cation/H+ exchanger [Benniella sp.]
MASPVVLDAAPEHVAYALLGCFIIFFGLVSLFVKEKLFISEAFVSTAFGIIIGPYALGIFDPMSWKEYDVVTLEFTRIVIAVQVMAAGVSLPRSYILQEKRSMFMMIVPLMVCMWITSSSLIWALIPDLDFTEAMILAACVTPTDPVLSNSVVKGRFAEKYVPPRIRYLLSAESGINDGMGIPFLYLGLYLLREQTIGGAFTKWCYMIWAYQILLSVVIGGLVGAAARKLVKGAKNRNLIDKESFLVFSIALALAVSGCVSILASDDLLAVFIAGNVFAWDDWFSNEIAEAHIQEIIDMLLNLACFVYIGASIPFSRFHDLILELSVWRLIVLAIVVLIFRRMPFVIAMKPLIPALSTYREAAFAGWFGPIGVGAVYLSKIAAGMTDEAHMSENTPNIERLLRVRSVIFPVVMFLVFSSVLIHGITVPLLHLQYNECLFRHC